MMKCYPIQEAPIKVFGLPLLYETGQYRKLTEDIMEKIPTISQFGMRTTGGRIGFRTDASSFTLRSRLRINGSNEGHSNVSLSGFNVYVGERSSAHFAGCAFIRENTGEFETIEFTFEKKAQMEDVIIFMPAVVVIDYCEILIEDTARVLEPTPYKWPVPVIYYGSSITAGGAPTRVGNTYVSLLSRWLDIDYEVYGFPGNAKGEIEMARYLAKREMSVFVYDYDHNAPDSEFLWKTHKPFFDEMRRLKPTVPIIMLSRPGYDRDPEDAEKRKSAILHTYHCALENGDKNVYFIDGKELFGTEERHACTVDGVHPTDYGMMQMAKCIRPTLEKALESTLLG